MTARKLVAWLSLVTVLSALNYSSRAAGGEPERNAVFHYDLAIGGLVLYAVMLWVVLRIARGKGSGVEVDMRIAYMFELDDSATKAMHLYATLDEAVAEAERREAEAAD